MLSANMRISDGILYFLLMNRQANGTVKKRTIKKLLKLALSVLSWSSKRGYPVFKFMHFNLQRNTLTISFLPFPPIKISHSSCRGCHCRLTDDDVFDMEPVPPLLNLTMAICSSECKISRFFLASLISSFVL